MELRRTVILIALAVVSYFLFLNWQQDYAPKPEAAPVAEEQAVAVDNPAVTAGAAASVDVPQAVATTPAASDVPVAVTPPSQALAETAKVSAERGTGGVVRVSTDVLNVDIDINGGDIVRVALPAFT
ncbi:membrane protein insertase YidC, partial [Amnimonas aquatica]